MMKRLFIVAALLLVIAAGAFAQVERAYLVTNVACNRVLAASKNCTTSTYMTGYFRYFGIGHLQFHKAAACSGLVRLQVSSRPDSTKSAWQDADTLWQSSSPVDTLPQREALGVFSCPIVPAIRFIIESAAGNTATAFFEMDFIEGN
jgi:hypothetical protein